MEEIRSIGTLAGSSNGSRPLSSVTDYHWRQGFSGTGSVHSQDAMRRQYLPNLVRTASGGLSLSQNLGIPCPAQLEA